MHPAAMKAGLETLYFSGAHRALAPFARGRGLIFMLHHVTAAPQPAFAPNGALHVTPQFLGAAVERVRARGVEVVSLDEALDRLTAPTPQRRNRPFAAFTFDDGYKDNFTLAYPVLKALACPFTVYVSTSLPDGAAELWWQALERVIADNAAIEVAREGRQETYDCSTVAAKHATWGVLYPWLRAAPEADQRDFVRALARAYGVSLEALCADQAMSWDELRTLAADPLVTIGAHTINHYALAKLDPEPAKAEIDDGARALEHQLGRRPAHLAYPYGDTASAGARDFAIARTLGFKSAVTTRKGMLYEEHRDHLFALPRVALNGGFQALRYVDVFLSGAPFWIFNRFRRLQVA